MMHTGLNPNYTAATYIDPEKDIGVVVVCNCVSNAPENVAGACFSILEGAPHYPKNEPSSGYTMDLIGTVMICIFLAVAALQIFLIGYTSFGYKMFYFWGYRSVIVMLVMLSAVFFSR